MNRETFLNELMAGLTQLGPVEQRQVADYYNELIFDGVENGKPEEEIIAGFGAPEEIAAQIRVEYKSQQAVEGAPGQGAVPPRPACLEYPAQEPVHTVVVDARNVRVNVRAVPGGGVRVLFQPRENDRVTVAEKDGAFLFTHTMSIFNVWNWLDLLRGPRPMTPYDAQFLRDRLRGKEYLPLAYFAGATPQNSYVPTQPYVLNVLADPRPQDIEPGYLRLFIATPGADSPRPIKLRQKPSTGEWFLWEYSSPLSGIRIPAAQDPWA